MTNRTAERYNEKNLTRRKSEGKARKILIWQEVYGKWLRLLKAAAAGYKRAPGGSFFVPSIRNSSEFPIEQKAEEESMEKEGAKKETRIAVIGIIIEDRQRAGQVNDLLHQYGEYVIGRMGLPYEKKGVHIISIVVDAPMDVISALSGKLGRLPGVSSKALYSKMGEKGEQG